MSDNKSSLAHCHRLVQREGQCLNIFGVNLENG